MPKMITAEQWAFFKRNYSDQVAQAKTITIPAEAWQIKSYWKKKKSNNITRSLADHADPVGAMVTWCEETLEDRFYVEKANDEWWVKAIRFYFFSEDDAVLFKLTWWENG